VSTIEAVIWDFGGVISSSPFEAFARFEAERGLPHGFIRSVNATNPHENAWARLERSDFGLDAFDEAFAQESRALGHEVRGADILPLLGGVVRPEMVEALRRIGARLKTGEFHVRLDRFRCREQDVRRILERPVLARLRDVPVPDLDAASHEAPL